MALPFGATLPEFMRPDYSENSRYTWRTDAYNSIVHLRSELAPGKESGSKDEVVGEAAIRAAVEKAGELGVWNKEYSWVYVDEQAYGYTIGDKVIGWAAVSDVKKIGEYLKMGAKAEAIVAVNDPGSRVTVFFKGSASAGWWGVVSPDGEYISTVLSARDNALYSVGHEAWHQNNARYTLADKEFLADQAGSNFCRDAGGCRP